MAQALVTMKSVVFCSSQRFKKELAEFIAQLKTESAAQNIHLVIFDPEFEDRENQLHLISEKERMNDSQYRNSVAGRVYDHLFRKVRIADVCYIFNKDGYLGANTNGELFAAAVLGKTIYAYYDKTLMGNYPHELYEEPSSRKLVHEVVQSPKELLKRLI